jgi:hypothetical protein
MSQERTEPAVPEIAEIFHDVRDQEEPTRAQFILERWLQDPPSYMVRLALACAGFKIYRGGDKSVWEARLEYEGILFCISDWKRQSWRIISTEKGEGILATAARLKKKIGQAGQRLDGMVSEWGRSLVAEGEFYVANPYPKVRGAYDHFRHAMEHPSTPTLNEEEIKSLDDGPKKVSLSPDRPSGVTVNLDVEMTRRLNEELRRRSDIVHNGYAAVGFFFSSLEVLFDGLFAVSDRTESFRDFRNRSWAERFKLVLPPASDKDLAKIYGDLRRIKSDVRDTLFHGTGDDESLLVAFPRLGMVPVSYQGTTDSVLFNSMAVLDEDLLTQAMQTFDAFDGWIEAHKPHCHVLGYIASGFLIPFYGDALERLRKVIEDETEFNEFMEDELRAADYYLNDYSYP